jgi:hypothetical protein
MTEHDIEVSFRGRTGVLGVSPILNKKFPCRGELICSPYLIVNGGFRGLDNI